MIEELANCYGMVMISKNVVLQEFLFMVDLLHMKCWVFQRLLHYIMSIALWPAQLSLLMMYRLQSITYIVSEGTQDLFYNLSSHP
jgi:hypothetical protein